MKHNGSNKRSARREIPEQDGSLRRGGAENDAKKEEKKKTAPVWSDAASGGGHGSYPASDGLDGSGRGDRP